MKRKLALAMAAFLCLASAASAEVFRFSYAKGEHYRIVSRVHESVFVNRHFSHESDILDRIAVTVTDVAGGTGSHDAVFQTSERAWGSGGAFDWAEEYETRFTRDERGAYTVDPQYFMPMVRDVPLFPATDISPGDTWTAPGIEVHDLRASFGVAEPVRFPITARYLYKGRETRDGVDCAVFTIDYEVFHPVNVERGTVSMYPVRVAGSSHQTFWWDVAAGRPRDDEESFNFIYTLNTGDEVEYRGTSEGHLIEAAPMDRGRVADDIKRKLDDQQIPGVTVKPTDDGVTITMENVNFPPNSDTLLPAEQEKLRRVAEILRQYPDRDIAVTGFTARAPGYTEDDYQRLSELRAKAAAAALLSLGARRAEQMTVRGMGAANPVADNDTEAGRRKNRRVEITLLEN